MRLREFQDALADRLNGGTFGAVRLAADRARLERVASSAGFRLTSRVRRSWRRARAAASAFATLGAIPARRRAELVDAWLAQGGGLSIFGGVEAGSFLPFLAERLADHPQARAICAIELATIRAQAASIDFVPPSGATLADPRVRLNRHPAAALIVVAEDVPVLFAPGLDGLHAPASAADVAAWDLLLVGPGLGALRRRFGAAKVRELVRAGVAGIRAGAAPSTP